MAHNSKRVGTSPKAEASSTPASPDSEEMLPRDEQSNAMEEKPKAEDIVEFVSVSNQLEEELCGIVVGQERVIRELLLALLAGGHVLLEGVPGLGKTLLVRTLADVFALKFARIQFTPDLMPADIVGTTIVSEQTD